MKLLFTLKSFALRHKILTAMVVITLITVVALKLWDIVHTPSDLGARIEYVGKHQFQCLPNPLNFICIGGGQYYVYYFATDMSPEELQKYFAKATYIPDVNDGGGTSAFYTYSNLYFKQKGSEATFSLSYYSNNVIIEQFGLKRTNKHYAVSMLVPDYELAKKSL